MISRPVVEATLVAILLAVSTATFAADSQDEESMEEVVVTGSLIKGTPMDAALPVEVFTSAELEDLGGPTALEFVKSLTVSGPTWGEGYYFSGSALTGNVGYNLRGLGTDKTLTLFNGRRTFENSSTVPSSAIERIEILKDGAAVTYGADATGGVVNYITKDSFEGFDLGVSYKGVQDSDGEWSMSLLGGFQFGDTNLMVAGEWDHRSEVDAVDRDFAHQPYSVNPAPWSSLTNLGSYLAKHSSGITTGLVNDFTQDSCEAVGGVYDRISVFPICRYGYIPYYNVVEENDMYRLYLQANTEMTDNMEFYVRVNFARVDVPNAYGSPAQPVIRGPATTDGATFQFRVPIENPYVGEFMARNGFSSNPFFPTAYFTPFLYRAFAHGGNYLWQQDDSYSVPNETDTKYWHISTGVNGTLANEIGYDFAITYNQYNYNTTSPDILGFRLQEALNGFGGPNCNAADLDPDAFGTQNAAAAGTGGCMWWNPFASAWPSQPVLGLINPSHQSGEEIPLSLISWVFDQRHFEETYWSTTVDVVFDGSTPLELGGGTVSWAAGLQMRWLELRESVRSDFYNGKTPCAWPGQDPAFPGDAGYTGCTPDEPGPFVFFGTNPPDALNRDQISYFLELNLPVTETFDMIASARQENFEPGDLDTTVYKVSLKWDITQNLTFRGSYGTNYQAPDLDVVPGSIENTVASYTIANGNWRGAQTVYRTDIEPETATVWSTGLIWQSEGFTTGSNFRFIVDYWDIETEDELGLLAEANDVANAVFSISPDGPGTPVPTDGTALARCSHPLVDRVTFNGSCVQGTTTATDFASIRRDYGNGPGQLTTGYDFNISYEFPAFDGHLRFGLTATKVEKFDFTPTTLDGYQLDAGEDRLGQLNFAAIG
ncbi:MAG: TonB-dependent receptor [Pseudomonadales bacterium]|nr:TonB-dependent receptor [Pseudomonadales bacterium]